MFFDVPNALTFQLPAAFGLQSFKSTLNQELPTHDELYFLIIFCHCILMKIIFYRLIIISSELNKVFYSHLLRYTFSNVECHFFQQFWMHIQSQLVFSWLIYQILTKYDRYHISYPVAFVFGWLLLQLEISTNSFFSKLGLIG